MPQTVAFQATGALNEYLEEEAENRMASKSMVCQMLLVEHIEECLGDGLDNEDDGGSKEGLDMSIVENEEYHGGEVKEVHLPTRQAAESFRESIGDRWLSDMDDLRTKKVGLDPETPDGVVEEVLSTIQ